MARERFAVAGDTELPFPRVLPSHDAWLADFAERPRGRDGAAYGRRDTACRDAQYPYRLKEGSTI